MSVNYGIFRKLLTLDELFVLHSYIGKSIFTCIDIENINKDRESTNNSIQLLVDTLLIKYNLESKKYYKLLNFDNKTSFAAELFKMLLLNYPDAFSFINSAEIRYDEIEAKYYTKRNFVKLELSGLLMLLNGMNIVQFKGNYIYFIEKALLDNLVEIRNKQKRTSLAELKEQLAIKEQLGNDAEITALEYEKSLLLLKNILKVPERVSLYDVKAGYDIASYMTSESNIPDKFIEVKSCADESLSFYMSRNEIETAKKKGSYYYLYLLNRKTNEFKVISDPYNTFFEREIRNWALEPQVYQIHIIKE